MADLHKSHFASSLVALALAATMALPGGGTAAAAEAASGAASTVVELFTSQSCYSCPPAEAFLGELAERPDLVALEYHVDYWDDLVYGASGRWKDPFSDPAHTRRQQLYARSIPGAKVYTPQMVIDGRLETVGSRQSAVYQRIDSARGERGQPPSLTVERGAAGSGLTVALDGTMPGGAAAAPVELWLVSFEREHVTEVVAGENKGKTLSNHHVVTAMEKLGDWSGGPLELPAAAPAGESQGCAVLAQAPGQGPILAARYCPASPDA